MGVWLHKGQLAKETHLDGFEEYSHFFEVKLDQFDGPIDLLLHLVKQRELPIEKLALAEVTEQYLACLEAMRQIDLEVAGEYLVIAATLVSIKSSVLLDEPANFGIQLEEEGFDPHEELLQRLRDAEVFKEGADMLGEKKILGIDVFSSPSLLKEIEPPPVEFVDHDPMLLGKAFRQILDELSEADTYKISLEEISIVDMMMTVLDKLKTIGGASAFYKLIPNRQSKMSVIATFVSLLELSKRQVICVTQDEESSDIVVSLATEDTSTLELSSEFDGVQSSEQAANQ